MSELVKRKLNKRDATKLTKQIRSTIDELETLILQAIEGQAWLSLGYETAEEWWREEIGPRRLGGESRDAVILQIASEQENKPALLRIGQREIGSLVGASKDTVNRVVGTLTPSVSVETHEDDVDTNDIIDAELIEESITGKNIYDTVQEHNRRNPMEPAQDTPESAARWIPALVEAINADLDAITDWQEVSDEATKQQLREELDIIRDKINRLEEKL